MRCAGDERRRDVERPNGFRERHGGQLDATGQNDRSLHGTSPFHHTYSKEDGD